MTTTRWQPAVCSWSLRASSPEDLAARLRDCNLAGVQLHLDPIRTGKWSESRTRETLASSGITLVSGMMAMEGEDYTTLDTIATTGGVRPDAAWPANIAAAHANADLARRLGLSLVTFHAGFVPHDPADPERARIVARTRDIADAFIARGLGVALETGQESAPNLITFLAQLNAGRPPSDHIGVNFDPANMILYGTGHPIEALRLLLPQVVQVHIKDARPSPIPGQWGTETPAGQGAVPWPDFFATLRISHRVRSLVIEREGGDTREADVRTAAALLERLAFGGTS